MCRSLRDMDLFMQTVLDHKPNPRDPLLVPVPWTGMKTLPTSKLKIGIMAMDDIIIPMPPLSRAIAWAQKKLESCPDVEVKSFAPYRAREALDLTRRIFTPDGGVGFRKLLTASGEVKHSCLPQSSTRPRTPVMSARSPCCEQSGTTTESR